MNAGPAANPVVRKRRRWWIPVAVVVGLLCLLYVGFFSLISIQDHVWFARKTGVVGAAARLHLRYLRVFDPEAQNRDGDPLLHVALYNTFGVFPRRQDDQARMALARVLLERGADVDSPNRDGMTALMAALADYNDTKALALLSLGADPKARGTGPYHDESAVSLMRRQVARDLAAYPRILRCDEELLRTDAYWKMVNVRFAMRTAHIDPRHCQPKTEAEIEALVGRYADGIRRQRVAEALRGAVGATRR